MTHVRSGQVEEARAEIAEVLRIDPNVTISGTARTLTTFKHAKDDKHFYDALRWAGLPESVRQKDKEWAKVDQGDIPTGPDDVRFQGKTGNSWPTTGMTRLTHCCRGSFDNFVGTN